MSQSLPRPPRLLLVATVVLAATGMILLSLPVNSPSSSTAPSGPAAAASTTRSALPAGTPPAEAGAPPAVDGASQAGVTSPSALPPHGEGIAGDREIQRALESAWPADLAPEDARHLLGAGRDLLRADATGLGRSAWPALFGDPHQAVAPAFASARFRIQAAIARRDGTADRAVVHLVWAGEDRGGTYTDGRITDLYFTRTTSTKGASAWTPQPHA
ncbi:hypothetical protein [Streptomyces sp. NPDC058434]|uniref:hypothetical protein n=1 Tax=Streptomyces sp. NPDC058434 TaxID=3346498 RepID=UPI003666B8F4